MRGWVAHIKKKPGTWPGFFDSLEQRVRIFRFLFPRQQCAQPFFRRLLAVQHGTHAVGDRQVDAMAARAEMVMPGENVLAHTAHLYQPGTRRPYGVLEWPAMLRLLEAEERNSGYPPYWH